MRRPPIVRIAEWTGWCGPCAAERPLVLTRTGRHTLRSWLTGSGDAERPLTLTCRLCGVGSVVPPEADDPEVVLDDEPVVAPELLLPGAPDSADPAGDEPLLGADAPDRSLPATARADLAVAVPAPAAGALPVVEAAPTPAAVPVPAAPGVVALPALAVASLPVAGPDLQPARQAVADALSQLLHRRATEAPSTPFTTQLPQQRSSEEEPAVDGVQALQLLAEGLDLLSTTSR